MSRVSPLKGEADVQNILSQANGHGKLNKSTGKYNRGSSYARPKSKDRLY